ncbi:uncharacterized protein STEHIDRAFT_148818 [Stereum hirsutum FP-91666 SS1]|uniref:uncharacterized protein n=1 Tax=Stereum hirsutum (strain FP-91666) TaxID=721885 RepID=UPI000444A8B9|nr:uncharacterized protein STEHIDRAFT_148818 [Stereum hirsutum FP-91666 SS1]EIM83215.1 hypothetical protein STEHIDRAFT_148818 [Stereum hirsutum FP-91666 SS1]
MAVTSPTELPTPQTLQEIAKVEVWDEDGNKVPFGSIYGEEKAVVVFIRHFFCGLCQQYTSQLAAVKSEALQAANTKIVVVGCGEWKLMKDYKENTGFKGSIYADPDRALYRALDMKENMKGTPAGEKKRGYLQDSIVQNVVGAFKRGFKHPLNIGKQGNVSQNGGEFVFGPGDTCSFASRMQHTEDHVEIADLMKEAGVVFP